MFADHVRQGRDQGACLKHKRGASFWQAPRFFPDSSEALVIGDMQAIGSIRLANLELLIREAGTMDALAEAVGSSPIYLSQIRNRALDTKTKRPRELGTRLARRLEEAMDPPKPAGWMDQPHDGSEASGDMRTLLLAEIFNDVDEERRRLILTIAEQMRGPGGAALLAFFKSALRRIDEPTASPATHQ